MSYTIHITYHPQYLHAMVEGDNSAKNVDRYFTDIQHAIGEHRCTNVLIEERLTGPGLDPFDIFEVIRTQARFARSHQLRIAYVDLNKDHHRTTVAFGENLANILGVNIKVFSTSLEAMVWLTRTDLSRQNDEQ
ncbi:MAG: hypothetical protein WCW35_12295 [Bacteroidota bacterium]|jgi:hypothetical protein